MQSVVPFAPPSGEKSHLKKQDRRRWTRVDLNLPLRFLSESGHEVTGETINVSGGGVLFRTQSPPFRGERIVCYISELGRMRGHVVRSSAGEVAVISDAPFTKRDRVADQLTWLYNKSSLKLDEERRASREGGSGLILVQCEDGRELRCHVMDMSLVGVALATTNQRPLLGERVQVGTQQGKVARFLPEGFAVDFTR